MKISWGKALSRGKRKYRSPEVLSHLKFGEIQRKSAQMECVGPMRGSESTGG